MGKALKVENLSKIYQLGQFGTGTVSRDLYRWVARLRGKEDPFLKIGETNNRTHRGGDIVYSLKDINFEIEQGDAIGIIGRNGAGKSTLLKILSKVTSPTTGRISTKGRVSSLLEVGTGFHPELTGRENIYLNGSILGMRKSEIKGKLDEIIDFSGVERYIDTPVKRYSSGMSVRLAFSVAAHLDSEILILDEVLAVGDAEFQKKCLGKMGDVCNREGRTILFVSHNLDAVARLCNKGLLLEDGINKKHGAVRDVIDLYLKQSNIQIQKEFEYQGLKPTITHVSISEADLKNHKLVVNMRYKTPFPLNPPVPGFVLYNQMNNPIFGSNTRFHKSNHNVIKNPGIEGNIQAEIENLNLHTGTYYISCFLGDHAQDYDEKKEAITFDYKSQFDYIQLPNPLEIGSIDLNVDWSVSN